MRKHPLSAKVLDTASPSREDTGGSRRADKGLPSFTRARVAVERRSPLARRKRLRFTYPFTSTPRLDESRVIPRHVS